MMGFGRRAILISEKGVNSGVATLDASGDLVTEQVPPIIASDTTGNAATASELAAARTISLTGDVTGSTAFDGSANVAIAATVADNSHDHTWANISDAPAFSVAAAADTLARRNTSGDIQARLFRSEYAVTNESINYVMTQIDPVTNNYIRPSTPAQFRAEVTDGVYLPIGGKAADANLLDGVHLSGLVRGDGVNNGNVIVNTAGGDLMFTDPNNTSFTNYLWRDHSAGKLYIGTPEDVPTTRADMVTGNGESYWHDGNKPAISASASNGTLVQRHASGYIYANYFNTSTNDVSSGITRVCCETNNDGFIRHATAQVLKDFIGKVNDSDKLDNLNSSQFLRSDANDVKTAGYTRYNDNVELYFGNSNDMEIFHNGSYSYIRNNTNQLYIQQRQHGGWIYLQAEDTGGTNKGCAYFNAEYQRFFGNGSEKMRVTSLGVQLDHIYSLDGNTVTIGGGEMGGRLADPGFTLWSERLYLGAEGGLKVISSPDNLASWPNRHEATICDANGDSAFPGAISAERIVCGYNPGHNNSISCSGWFRSSGGTGWYNGTHGGGIYMVDSTWVRTYNGKSFYTGPGDLRTDGKLQIDGGNLEIDHINDTAIDNYVGNIYYRNYDHGHSHFFQAENTSGTNKACAYFNAEYQRLFNNGSEKLRTTSTGITVFGAVATSSSRELKNVLGFPENALEKIARINPVIYAMKDDETQKPQIGLIAEDVPDELLIAQKDGEPGEQAIAYDRLGVWAVAALKELTTRVENLEVNNA